MRALWRPVKESYFSGLDKDLTFYAAMQSIKANPSRLAIQLPGQGTNSKDGKFALVHVKKIGKIIIPLMR